MWKFLLIFLLISYKVSAQNCNCGENFKFLVNKIEKNYVGFNDKVTNKNRDRYQKFTDSLQVIAAQSNSYKCLITCREWLAFFKDKHLSMSLNFSNLHPDTIRSFFSNEEKIELNANQFNNYLKKNQELLDSVEGIWYSPPYRIGIIKDSLSSSTFIGFILNADSIRWVPKQIKFKLEKKDNKYQIKFFKTGDHTLKYPLVSFSNHDLNFGVYGKWYKESLNENNVKNISKIDNDVPTFKTLDDSTILIKLPYFGFKYKPKIDSLITQNKIKIEHTRHLIIDIRDNVGGTTKCFENLIPFLYTNPIKVNGGIVLATKDNIKDCYEKIYDMLPKEDSKELKLDIEKLKKHEGKFYKLYKDYTIKYSKVLKYLAKVSIIINNGTASSAELFLLRAEQSKKVTLYGENTSGAVDYGEIVYANAPCNLYSINYPASKSTHSISRPLDNRGITPKVIIPPQITDWVEFVRKHKVK